MRPYIQKIILFNPHLHTLQHQNYPRYDKSHFSYIQVQNHLYLLSYFWVYHHKGCLLLLRSRILHFNQTLNNPSTVELLVSVEVVQLIELNQFVAAVGDLSGDRFLGLIDDFGVAFEPDGYARFGGLGVEALLVDILDDGAS